jgi:hypothetical protein
MTGTGDHNQGELVSEMLARYPNEWVFFEIVAEDKYERPYRGILRSHHVDRDRIHEIVMETPRRHFAVWYSGRLLPEGCEVLL